MRKTFIVAVAIAMAMGMMTTAAAGDNGAAITSPSAGEIIYQNDLLLGATDTDAADNSVRWAVRYDSCAAATNNMVGNVDGMDDGFTWEEGAFSADVDISEFDAGRYCFVFNTEQGDAAGSRLTQWFYIVDEYAKVGGTLYLPIDWTGSEYDRPRANSPTHSIDGVVGVAGEAGVVGTIEVNYRQLGETLIFVAESYETRAAGGIGVTDSGAVAEVGVAGGGEFLILDRDAARASDLENADRGAIVFRYSGSPSLSQYEIDATPGEGGADSWVPMERGNTHVGTRGE